MSASPLLRPSCLALALSLACAVPLAHAQTAATDAAVIDYQIAAGPLGASLNRIAASAGRTLSVDPALLQGKQAKAVHGQYSVEQAAAQALQGSGLQLATTIGELLPGRFDISHMSGME